jgi:molybdenum cofactor cytidylyltransferase
MSTGIRGLLLCGGASLRFGAEKLLADVDGQPLVSRSARNLVNGAGNALAVVPPGNKALRRILEAAGCEVLESNDTSRGLGASLAAGVRHTPAAAGWIVALGDMPFILPGTIALVRAKLAEGAAIAAPVLLPKRERGHPVGFAESLRNELAALDGDEGARSVIARHAGAVVSIPVDDGGIVIDVDTPGDLEMARER